MIFLPALAICTASLITFSAWSAPCENAEIIRTGSSELEGMTCLDTGPTVRVVGYGLVEKAIFHRAATGSSPEELRIVRARFDTRSADILETAVIAKPEYFPADCARSLVGARILPGSDAIAILYASQGIRIVNTVTDALESEFLEGATDGGGCKASEPSAEAERERVVVRDDSHELAFDYRSADGSTREQSIAY